MNTASPKTPTIEQESPVTAIITRSTLETILVDHADLDDTQREAVLHLVEDVCRGADAADVDVQPLEKGYVSPVRLTRPRVVVRSVSLKRDIIDGLEDAGDLAVTIDAADYLDPGRSGYFPRIREHRDIVALHEYGGTVHRSHPRHADGFKLGGTDIEHGGLSVVGVAGKRGGGWHLSSGIYVTPWRQTLRVTVA